MISKKRCERVIRKIGDCGYKNVQSITYPQMRHEILNEIDKQKVWVDVLSFIGSAYSDK